MTIIAFIRHGLTEWNREKRVQGLRDIPLSPQGIAALRDCALPARLAHAQWFVSPLARALETAALLGIEAEPEPLLIEMDWGEWEGRTVRELRATDPEAMAENEQKGVGFRPPGGESPADVQERVLDWAESLTGTFGASAHPGAFGAITHKGVIRAAVALALGWDMREPEPVKLDWATAHILRLASDGHFQVVELNVALDKSTAA